MFGNKVQQYVWTKSHTGYQHLILTVKHGAIMIWARFAAMVLVDLTVSESTMNR